MTLAGIRNVCTSYVVEKKKKNEKRAAGVPYSGTEKVNRDGQGWKIPRQKRARYSSSQSAKIFYS